MPRSQFERAELASKWLYLGFGMAKWAKWFEHTDAMHVTKAGFMPANMDLIYQVAFTGYFILHVVVAIIKNRKK